MVDLEHAKEAAIQGAGSVRLAIVLYDQLIEDISRADDALVHCRAEQCATDIGHALAVIGYLQATLHHNRDRDLTRNSDTVYATLREKLIEAQVRSSRLILAQLRPQFKELREAWIDVEGGA
jgi:flagellin-specific chaperone FliS